MINAYNHSAVYNRQMDIVQQFVFVTFDKSEYAWSMVAVTIVGFNFIE